MQTRKYGVVLTAIEPISHHDPQTGDGGNTLTFMRHKQLVPMRFNDMPVWQHLLDKLCEGNPMPESIHELTQRLTMVEWVATAYVRLLIDIYGGYDGAGLFTGMARYEMLDRRLETSAVKAGSLHGLWNVLTSALKLGVHPAKYDEPLALFWTLPPSVQHQVLAKLSTDHRSIVSIARVWNNANKAQSEAYADKAQISFNPEQWWTPEFDGDDYQTPPEVAILNVPAISANSIRHQMVRYPGWIDMASRIGLVGGIQGTGELKPAMESLFDNGGNIKSGASIPGVPDEVVAQTMAMFINGGYKVGGSSESSRAYALAKMIRETYPLLDLVGGVCNAFDLGESMLKVGTWLVCRENRDALPDPVRETDAAKLSAFDYLTEITRTRQATMETQNQGQMIYNYEALVKGTQVYTEFTLLPTAQELTRGALMSALDTYAQQLNYVGGQSARGHGQVAMSWLTDQDMDAMAAYRAYVDENAENLKAWLLDGSLGTGTKWVVK